MAQIQWGASGARFFEAGVDRGVLYVGTKPGVPWNGLISVSEETVGGEAKAYYLDGVKYLNKASSEEFQATIEAYTYPDEFAECDGTAHVKNGLYVTQQSRKSFNLAYRSMVGNDTNGVNHAYKIHIVYDALAAPSGKTNTTLADSMEAFNFSWQITTRASAVTGRKPTSHFVIDSRTTPRNLIIQIENILYGTADADPRMPPVDELLYMFEAFENTYFDARVVGMAYYNTFDGGTLATSTTDPQTSTINGGVP